MERQAENHLAGQDQCEQHAIALRGSVSDAALPLPGRPQAALR
jgi:hypothetical protein